LWVANWKTKDSAPNESKHEYAIADSRQEVVLQLGGWARCNKSSPLKVGSLTYLGPGLGLWDGQYTMRGEVYRNIEVNLVEIKESKFYPKVIAELGVGNAAVSCRPAAQVSCCSVRFLFASKEGGLEANVKKIECILRLGQKVGCCEDGNVCVYVCMYHSYPSVSCHQHFVIR
jgi:hypothetical protein